ncbi:MAG: trigger factor [Bacteroidota bacterium]|nr:trigger factor [Bacteroidota bacterium]
MNVTKHQTDNLNATLTIDVAKADYSDRVQKILTDYRKTATVPGFRKGQVPMKLVEKQYGKAVLLDELNKIVQESLGKYINDEKLNILGNPIPVVEEEVNFDNEDFSFKFEIGLAPEFDVDFNVAKVDRYKVSADKKMIDEQVQRIQRQFGKLFNQEQVEENSEIRGVFVNQAENINQNATFNVEVINDKKIQKKLIGKKVGDVVSLPTKGMFADEHDLMNYLGVPHDKVHGLDIEVELTINQINGYELAEVNQELLDRIFGEGQVKSEDELRDKIKSESETYLQGQADQKFFEDTIKELVENTKFDLPAAFLKKWLKHTVEKPLTEQEIEKEYTNSEKMLRYQLIESKIIVDNNLQNSLDEIKAKTSEIIRSQMAQFGQLDPSVQDVENIVNRVLSNQDEVRRVSEQVMNAKLIKLFEEKLQAPVKEVNYPDFVKAIYGDK